MTTKHTPTPWTAIPGREIKTAKRQNFTLWQDNKTEDGYTVAGLESVLPANAAFIVRAVNSHDTLVAALPALERMERDNEREAASVEMASLPLPALIAVRAALKLARGDQ